MAQNSRKRPAPGAAPLLPVAPMQRNYTNPPTTDDLLQWSTNGVPDGATNYNDLSRPFLMNGAQGPFQQQQIPLQAAPPQQGHLQPQTLQPQQVQQQQQQQPVQQQQQQLRPQPTSTAVARRPPNRALIPSVPRPSFDSGVVDPFGGLSDDPASFFGAQVNGSHALVSTSGHGNGGSGGHGLPGENESIEVLEERAQRIKKEAQAKRKQIPPFVQKLSSFLEEQKNTELIRWSENGDSFVVLDEDEFARTLIPELFKHNNYASFVRQLNMYGFHKRVGLSDNSMKASERKNKSPSEYYNPYFRRGHPNLLWLINKPKSGSKAKRGKREDGEGDSDEDANLDDAGLYGFQHGGGGGGGGLQGFGNAQGRNFAASASVSGVLGGLDAGDDVGMGGSGSLGNGLGGGSTSGELAPLQRKDFQIIKDELNTLRTRQAQISKVMQRLQYDNSQLQQQARMFQNMHERHENSINAILNFLANVFRKSLEEQGGVQGVTELLASILPNGQMPQGSVVDLGDDFDSRRPSDTTTALSTPPKRPQRLLPPIPSVAAAATKSSTASGSASGSVASASRSASSRGSKAMPAAGGMSPASQQFAAAIGGAGMGQGFRPPTQQPQQPAMGSVTELFDSPGDSTYLQQELHSNPHEGMMKIINDTNANTPSSLIDLPEMAASTPISLTSDQRDRVLNLMSGQGAQASTADLQRALSANNNSNNSNFAAGISAAGPGGGPAMPSTAPPAAANVADVPSMPSMQGGGGGGSVAPSTALSPILANMNAVPPPPSLKDIANTQAEIEALQRLQDEQNAKITDLSQLLGPLSPSGRVPGLEDDNITFSNLPGGQSPGYFDLGQYLDSSAFGEDFNFAANDPAAAAGSTDADSGQQPSAAPNGQNLDGANHHSFDGQWETGNKGEADCHISAGQDSAQLLDASPSPAPTEEILRTDMNSPTANKRRRVS